MWIPSVAAPARRIFDGPHTAPGLNSVPARASLYDRRAAPERPERLRCQGESLRHQRTTNLRISCCATALVALLMSACAGSAAYRSSVRATEAGRVDQALYYARQAAELRPGSERTMQQLVLAERLFTEDAEARAREALDAGRFDQAILIAGAAQQVQPNEVVYIQIADEARGAAADECRAFVAAGDLVDAIYSGRFHLRDTDNDALQACVSEALSARVTDLSTEALRLEEQDARGHALFVWLALLDVQPDDERARRRVAHLSASLVDEFMPSIAVSDPDARAQSASYAGNARVRHESAAGADVSVRVERGRVDFEEFFEASIATATYRDGEEIVENPAFGSALRDVADARRHVADARGRVDRERREYRIARDNEPYDRSDESAIRRYESNVSSARRDLERAESELRRYESYELDASEHLYNTPEFVSVPRMVEHRYEVRHHTRVASLEATFTVDTDKGTRTASHECRAETHDREHRAFAPAGIATDPLRFPDSDTSLERSAHAVVTTFLTREIDAALTTFRSAWLLGLNRDPSAAAWDQFAAYALLEPRPEGVVTQVMRDEFEIRQPVDWAALAGN